MARDSKKKILVVDDDADIRQLVRRILNKSYIVLEAANGEEAVNLARSQKPALIFMDMMMPRMDGLTACYRVKGDEETRGIQVVMLTAIDTEVNRKLAKDVWGADAYLKKPFEFQTLLETASRLIKAED